MSARTFWLKLLTFLAPLLVVYSIPVVVMVRSGEAFSPDILARWHARLPPSSIFGAGYTNPARRYKLISASLHDAPIVAIGSSRVMQFRETFFRGGSTDFYNAGGLAGNVWHLRRALARLPRELALKHLLVGLDQWWFNGNLPSERDDPAYEAELDDSADVLGNLRRGLQVWPDVQTRKVQLGPFFGGSRNLGVNGILRGNGFRRDGSYRYADIVAHPEATAESRLADILARVREGRDRLEPGHDVDEENLEETRRFLRACRTRGIEVVAFVPPYAPSVAEKVFASQAHTYVRAVGPRLRTIMTEEEVPFVDSTDCRAEGCVDEEFVDGLHGGDTVYARLALRLAELAPWLSDRLSPDLADRAARRAGMPLLDEP